MERSAFIVVYYSVLHRMTLIGHAHFFQSMNSKHLSMLNMPQIFFQNCRKIKYLPNLFTLCPQILWQYLT